MIDNIKEIKIVLESHFSVPRKSYKIVSKDHTPVAWDKIISVIQQALETAKEEL